MAKRSKAKVQSGLNSKVEQVALEKSGFDLMYGPTEKVGSIIIDNYPALGKLTAMRFIEWVQKNPEGVVSLPTGKTPEHFIKEITRYKNEWNTKKVAEELEKGGVDISKCPDFSGLHFVQIDEFYPINPHQHNSFYHYVNKYYIQRMGLDPKRALLINCDEIGLPKNKSLEEVWPELKVDLSLRFRLPHSNLERLQTDTIMRIDQWCQEYEEKIRDLGGIGFFLGGIGPDGHIGFNVRGSDHNCTTRLTEVNYETQAAAAGDLGGIDVSRNRLVITIGLSTITSRPDGVAIIFAAGEAKAGIVANAIESPRDVVYPGSCLQKLPDARFYITRGAATHLKERNLVSLARQEQLSDEQAEKIVIDISLGNQKKIDQLSKSDFLSDPAGKILMDRRGEEVGALKQKVVQNIKNKIEAGITARQNCTFFHTEPHHDDLMLGYLPYIVRNIRVSTNRHVFATLTSGFTAVTNEFMLVKLKNLIDLIDNGSFKELHRDGYFNPGNMESRNRDIWQYLDGVAAESEPIRIEGESRRLLRNLVEVFDEMDLTNLKERISGLIHYFETQYPGKKDLEYIQKLKGMCREWEAECVWGYFGWHSESVHHLRLGFYKGDIFTEEPTFVRDVLPVLQMLRDIKPNVVSVALDPEGSGPDTHYKVLQAISEGLKTYEQETGRHDIEVLGYRNVWFRFHPSDANLYIPVSMNMFALQDSTFMNNFISQRDASFPSYEHDGPFHELAHKIQIDQYQILKTCLGREFFYEHPSPLMRATRGIVFLKSMTLPQFYERSQELRKSTENID